MNLELMAMQWLRWDRRCMIVLTERSPRQWVCGRPDVLGITCARYLIEIEIKRSLSDFRADAKKSSRLNRMHYLKKHPKQFYYLIPRELLPSVSPIVPEWAGLITGPTPKSFAIIVEKIAPINSDSEKVSIKECLRMVHLVSNQAISEKVSSESIKSNWRYGYEPYWPIEYEI